MRRPWLSLLRIAAVLVRYRLDELIDAAHLFRPLKWLRALLPGPRADIAALPRGARLRLALQTLGPIYVKAGQVLSTRRDLLPDDVADELSLLQDQVAPFPGEQAIAAIEKTLGKPVTELFARFDVQPLASASIAQVHAATLHDGREVVVKVLRPGIERRIAEDLGLLKALADLADRHHPKSDHLRPLDVYREIECTLQNELDLEREGANASLLRRNFEGSPDLYVPSVHWDFTRGGVLTLERVYGIPVDDIEALDAAGIDRARLAAKGVRLFYTQVFRDNFFHADAHPGNVWVDPRSGKQPRFIALDFGIMGSLPVEDQRYLAENFTALFNRDWRRIAELHIESGWMPAHTRVDELEAAVRTVCEPYFTRPLSQISVAEVVIKLFRTAQRFELILQPQLILLQKTLLNIEGVGRVLDPDIDIWATARPLLADIVREKYGFTQAARELRDRLPSWLDKVPDIPRLVHDYLEQATRGRLTLRLTSADLHALAETSRIGHKRTVFAVLGSGLLIAAAVLWGLDAGEHRLGQP
ncbi:MAG TPA: ubiquinone biosynthesis regulatory protein kinase UbiB, partial [Xanthomonadaceae bacterium]|nr:ubiquinone biosynthesis regulatory protein kinase UbiB [Xanthomonadaceae bacterium]